MDIVQMFYEKAKAKPLKIVFPEGDDERIPPAAAKVKEIGIAVPIIVGNPDKVKELAKAKGVSVDGIEIVDPLTSPKLETYTKEYAQSRGMKETVAKKLVKDNYVFGAMMVKMDDADGMVGGVNCPTAKMISAASLTVGYEAGMSTASSFFIMVIPEYLGEKDKVLIYADCAVIPNPDAQQLAEIGISSGINAKNLVGLEPKIAFLSFSTKGSASHSDVDKVLKALEIAKKINEEKKLGFEIDGEMQADAAIVPKVGEKKAPGSKVAGKANVLIFPDLDAGNIGYKLTERIGKAKALGPILQGFAKPVNDMSRGASVQDLVDVAAITCVQAQGSKK